MNEPSLADRDELIQRLISDFGSDIWNYIFSLTRNVDLADDLTQDCFVRAYTHLETFRRESTIKTWLLKIARNLVYDQMKSASFTRVAVAPKVPENLGSTSAEQEALKNIVSEEIWRMVLTLPDKLREVLVLHAHHELSVAEVGELLGITQRAVRTRLHRARSMMRTLLKEGGWNGLE